MDAIIELGISFNQWIEQFRTVPLTKLFLFFHYAGTKYGYMLLLPIACFLKPKFAWPLIIAALSSWGVNVGLKEFFSLPRPFIIANTNPVILSSSYSFPSGHAQAAGLFWGFWIFHSKTIKQSIIPLAFLVLIGLSRVYLGVHYFTDVLAGWAIGLALAYIAFRASKIFTSTNEKVEA